MEMCTRDITHKCIVNIKKPGWIAIYIYGFKDKKVTKRFVLYR